MVGTARGSAVLVACAFTGCSFLAKAPPRSYKPSDGKPDCGSTTAALLADAAPVVGVTTLALGAMIVEGGGSGGGESHGSVIVPAIGIVTSPWLLGMFVGLNKRARCKAARRAWRADRQELLASLSSRTGAKASSDDRTVILDAPAGSSLCIQAGWRIAVSNSIPDLSHHGIARAICSVDGVAVWEGRLGIVAPARTLKGTSPVLSGWGRRDQETFHSSFMGEVTFADDGSLTGHFTIVTADDGEGATFCRYLRFRPIEIGDGRWIFDGHGVCISESSREQYQVLNRFSIVDHGSPGAGTDHIDVDHDGPVGPRIPGGLLSGGEFVSTE